MSFEAEVIPLFLAGISIFTVLELVVGCIMLKGRKKARNCLVGHAVSMAAAFFFLVRCIFGNRFGKWVDVQPGIASISNSVNIAWFGIFWALSVVLLLACLWGAIKDNEMQ